MSTRVVAPPSPPTKRLTAATRVAIWSGAVGTLIILTALSVHGWRQRMADIEARDAAKAQAEVDRQAAQEAAEKAATKMAAALQTAAVESAQAKSRAMDRGHRDAWIRWCVERPSCLEWQRQAMLDGVPPGIEHDHADRVMMAARIAQDTRKCRDGETVNIDAVADITGLLKQPNGGLPLLDTIATTPLADAKKDPDSARGKLIKVSGSIVEIHASGDTVEGALSTGNLDIIRFLTPLSTRGIYAHTWASFEGVFAQEYDYANVSGGQTRSSLIVGAFNLPENGR